MHIAFFIRNLDTGGTERQVVTLAAGLSKFGHTVDIVILKEENKFKDELLEITGVTIHVLGNNKRKYFVTRIAQWPLGLLKLRKFLKNEKPDVLYSMLQPINLIAWFATRFGYSNRLVWGVRASVLNFSRINMYSEILSSWVSPTVPAMIYNSKAGFDIYRQQGFRPKFNAIIHNGVDTDLFNLNSEKAKIFRHEFQIDSESTLIGIVARLTPLKDHSTFLHAASKVILKHPTAIFIVVGNGKDEYKKYLQNLSAQLGLSKHIKWIEDSKNLVGIYNALDILVSSSSSEGFSNVIAEAMACGTPCVATDVGDSKIILGNTGILIPPNDASSMSQAICALMNSDSALLSKISRDRITSEFSVVKLLSRTEKVLSKLGQ